MSHRSTWSIGHFRTVVVALLATVVALALVGVASTPRSAAATSNPASFHYYDLAPNRPVQLTDKNVGTFIAQVKYGNKPSMPFAWQISRSNQVEAGHREVTTEIHVTVSKRCMNYHYDPHTAAADYTFHSTLTSFNYCGDAPWTKHSIKAGYVVTITIQSTFPVSPKTVKILTCNVVLRLVK